MKLNVLTNNSDITIKDSERKQALAILAELREDKEAYTGWVNQPQNISDESLNEIIEVAKNIQKKCDKLIVIGIGGSYLGSAAVIYALGGSMPGCPEVIYAGINLSGFYHSRFEKIVKDNDVCVCVVSKSGGTMETRLAFSYIKSLMYDKYGKEETAKRIVAITDPKKGLLREEVNEEGYISFGIPSNIGGRYSAYTAGIMFPLAVAGVDIKDFVKGAAEIAQDDKFWNGEGLDYALTRYALLEQGKKIEVFEAYDPSLRLIGEWCKQLFGESEGKEGKGLFPASLTLSADLHSMGQFLQEGSPVFFETVIDVLNRELDIDIPESAGELLAGRKFNEINKMAVEGVIKAHRQASVPVIKLEIDDCKEYSLGQLLYFLMITAAVTGKLMGVDPFNQPGVEAYKAEIRALLGQ